MAWFSWSATKNLPSGLCQTPFVWFPSLHGPHFLMNGLNACGLQVQKMGYLGLNLDSTELQKYMAMQKRVLGFSTVPVAESKAQGGRAALLCLSSLPPWHEAIRCENMHTSKEYTIPGEELSIRSYSQKKMFLVSSQFWRCFWKNGVNMTLFKIKKKKKSCSRNNSLCEVDKLQTKGKTKPASQRYKKNISFYLMLPGRLCKQT